jgi:branched-chain amino acid transport system substrate-binding protein
MRVRRLLGAACAFAGVLPFAAAAQDIKVGFPMILSGPGALSGEPALRGAEMLVEEVNAAGGVLNGRKLRLIARDTKGAADEAVRVAREMILKDEVNFLVGTFTSAEGPAVSPIAKENQIVFIAPVTKTDQLTAPDKLHPYVFRTASTTTIEGRSAAELAAKLPNVKRVATMTQDYAYGQDTAKAFLDHLKTLRPDIEVVDQQWPKLGEADYTPFINAQMAKKPDAVFSSLWGGHFVTFAKQAKPLGYFDAIKNNFIGAGEAGAIETAKAMGSDYPAGIWANSYDISNWESGPQSHKDYIARLRKFTKDENPSSWPITGYVAMQALVAGIKKANSIDSDKVAKALLDITFDAPTGQITLRGKDHNANRGQFWGLMVMDPKYPFAVMAEANYLEPTKFMD